MGIDMQDVTGQPRPRKDIEDALKWATKKMITSMTEMTEEGPSFMHLATIRYVFQQMLRDGSARMGD